MYKKIMILLSAVSLIQAFDRGTREVSTPRGHVGRTFVVDADSQLGSIMQSMNDREAQQQLEAFRKMAQQTSLTKAIDQCDKFAQDLRKAIENGDSMNENWLRRVLAFTERNCKTLKLDKNNEFDF